MKIINRIINAGNSIAENRRLEIPIKLNQEPDTAHFSRRNGAKVSKFAKLKNFINSKLIYLDKATVKRLDTVSPNEFWDEAQKVISDGIGIPKNLRSPIYGQQMDPKIAAFYSWDTNITFVNKSAQDMKRSKLFMMLRHEFEHQKQNFDVLRTEGLGEIATKRYANAKTELAIKQFRESFDMIPESKLEELRAQLGESFELVKSYKAAQNNGNANEFLKNAAQEQYDIELQSLETFRKQVIKEMGTIPANSKEAKHAKEYFDGMLTTQNRLTSFKTITQTRHESEAYIAGFVGYFEYLIKKFF